MILLPPAAITGWSPDEIEMVLLHELAHVRRWDNLVNLLQRCVESLLFFHPAVWLVSSWVRREREACCDAIVVHRTNRPHAYAELLVALAAQMPRSVLFHPAASSAMAAGPLRRRIRRILQLDDDPMLISGKSFTVMLAGLLVAATLAVLYLPTIGQAEESSTGVTESTEKTSEKNKNESVSSSAAEPPIADAPSPNAAPDSGEPQILATFPGDSLTESNAFPEAYRKARKNNQYVDLIFRENDMSLVVADPEPNEKNWPDVLGETPRKDRVIAEKAYARLGLKLAPCNMAEVTYRQMTGKPLGVHIVGGNVPKGLPLPSLLTQIIGERIQSMDAMLSWLESPEGESSSSVKCYAIADDKEYLFEAAPLAPTLQPAATTFQSSPGPTPLPDLDRGGLKFLFFHSPASQPSKEMQPIAEEVAKQFPAAQFQLVDASQNPQLARKYNVDATPTCLIVRNGTVIARLVGLLPKEMIRKTVEASVESVAGQTPQTPIDPQSDLPRYEIPSPETEADAPKPRSQNRRVAVPSAASPPESALRYDGKSFDAWQTQWKHELSNQKRAEAVRALAAFGRAGYGKDATEAILDVAGDYEFYSFTNDDAEMRLKETITRELARETGKLELSKYWLPDLASRLNRDPEKWKDWATNLLHHLNTADPAGQTLLKSLTHEGPSDVRSAALGALIRASRSPDRKLTLDKETRELLRSALKSDDSMTIKFALQYLSYPVTAGVEPPTLLFQPELVALLFHADAAVQRTARGCLRHIDAKDAPKVIEQLIGVSQDESKQPDQRRAAIRALAALGERAQPAIPALRNLVKPSASEGTLFATFVALQNITREKYARDFKVFGFDDFTEGLDEHDRNAIRAKMRGNSPPFNATVNEETKSLVPQPNEQLGGGFF
jgi:thiol-disulfide isomerase/thioredoxin